jgi:predicted CXXCH cytochrome family protein
MTCHETHGSANPRQLTRADVRQLCLECHSTLPSGPIGSQPPSTHDMLSPRYRNCVQCHTAIHGSSKSPVLLK